jgi:hypothetical protein
MSSDSNERQSARRRFRILGAMFAAVIFAAGLSAVVLESSSTPASATTVGFSQCNGHAADPSGAALTETCSISITNNISAAGGTSSSTTIITSCTLGPCTSQTLNSSDVVNAVHQCNFSNIEGGSNTVCNVNIVNNIALDGAAPATALTLDQCNGSGGGGGTNMTACIPSSQGSPTVVQCDRSGVGGGGFMVCDATGTVSASFPMFIDQCNDSETGGGSTVICHVSITTNVTDTSVPTVTTPAGGTPGGGLPGGGTPETGTPGTGTPGPPETGTPGTPTGPPFVEVPPNYTG